MGYHCAILLRLIITAAISTGKGRVNVNIPILERTTYICLGIGEVAHILGHRNIATSSGDVDDEFLVE